MVWHAPICKDVENSIQRTIFSTANLAQELRLESCANDGSEEMDCEMKAHNSYTTGGRFKYCILYFHPDPWGNDPI